MKSKVYKIVVFCLVMLLCLGSITGCKRQTDEAFLDMAASLLEQSERVNTICFGEGIGQKKDGFRKGSYTEADEQMLAAYGISTVTDMKQMVREVYTVNTADWIESVVFRPITDGTSVLSYSRYYDDVKPHETEGEIPVIMVKNEYEKFYGKQSTVYQNLRISVSKRSRVVILADATVTDGEGNVMEQKDISLSFRYEMEGWRLDTPSYVVMGMEK